MFIVGMLKTRQKYNTDFKTSTQMNSPAFPCPVQIEV